MRSVQVRTLSTEAFLPSYANNCQVVELGENGIRVEEGEVCHRFRII